MISIICLVSFDCQYIVVLVPLLVVPVARYSAWHRWEHGSGGTMRSSVGSRYSAGTCGWHAPSLS